MIEVIDPRPRSSPPSKAELLLDLFNRRVGRENVQSLPREVRELGNADNGPVAMLNCRANSALQLRIRADACLKDWEDEQERIAMERSSQSSIS